MSTMHRPLTMWLPATLASGNVHPASDAVRRPVLLVVLHNYAAIAPRILEQAAREVGHAYGELGVEVRWGAPPLELDQPGDILNETLVATIHLRLFERDGRDRVFTGVIGIDAPRAARGEAERLQRGESPFTAGEAERIRAGAWSVAR